MAIYYIAPFGQSTNIIVAFLTCIVLLLIYFQKKPYFKRLLTTFIFIIIILAWYSSIKPRTDRNWADDVGKLPTVEISQDIITISNIRAFNYRSETDYDINYITNKYDLEKLFSVDMFLNYWGSPHIAHPILSFGFTDGQQLAISIETRKKKGDAYSAIKGFFKAYELIYIPALETDIVRLRTNFRKEDTYLYRLVTPPDKARLLLLNYIKRIEDLNNQPEFYNAATNNCTTNVFFSFKNFRHLLKMNYKVLLSGHLDEFAYTAEALYKEISFDELKSKSYISKKAQVLPEKDFSKEIRKGLLVPKKLININQF